MVLGIELTVGLCTCVTWALGLERAMSTYWRPGCDSRVCSYLSFKIPRNPPHEMGIRDEENVSWRSQRCPRPPGCPAKSPFDFHICCVHSFITLETIQVYNVNGALVVKLTCCIAQIKGRYMGAKVIAGSLSPSQRDPGTMSLGGSVGWDPAHKDSSVQHPLPVT